MLLGIKQNLIKYPKNVEGNLKPFKCEICLKSCGEKDT